MLGVVLVKVAIILVLVLAVLGVGLLPILFNSTNKGYLSVLTSAAGGVLLGTVLLHLIPEVLDDGEAFKCHLSISTGYPISLLFIAVGFLLILLIEKSVEEARLAGRKAEEIPLIPIPNSSAHDDGNSAAEAINTNGYNTAAGRDRLGEPEPGGCDVHRSEVSSYIFVLALAVHSVMEGLAIGVAQTMGDTMTLFITVILHKLCLAFAVGIKLHQDNKSFLHHLTGLLVFALSAPIGVVLGLVITNILAPGALYIAMFLINALATGTFIYITFLEILGPEFQTRHINQLYKSAAVVAGFTLMGAIFFFTHEYTGPYCGTPFDRAASRQQGRGTG